MSKENMRIIWNNTVKNFLGDQVVVELTDGSKVSGILHENTTFKDGYLYCMKGRSADRNVYFEPKHIAKIEVIKDKGAINEIQEKLDNLLGKIVDIQYYDHGKDRGRLKKDKRGYYYCHLKGAESCMFFKAEHVEKVEEVK